MCNIYCANENNRFGKLYQLFVDKNKVNVNYLEALVTWIDEVLLGYTHISQINFMQFSAIRKRHLQFLFLALKLACIFHIF